MTFSLDYDRRRGRSHAAILLFFLTAVTGVNERSSANFVPRRDWHNISIATSVGTSVQLDVIRDSRHKLVSLTIGQQ
jgi:hypothetical protein